MAFYPNNAGVIAVGLFVVVIVIVGGGDGRMFFLQRKGRGRQHRSTRAAGIHDHILTPGGSWAPDGGGGASNVDVPGSNLKLN